MSEGQAQGLARGCVQWGLVRVPFTHAGLGQSTAGHGSEPFGQACREVLDVLVGGRWQGQEFCLAIRVL